MARFSNSTCIAKCYLGNATKRKPLNEGDRSAAASNSVNGERRWTMKSHEQAGRAEVQLGFNVTMTAHVYFAKHMPGSAHSAFVTWLRGA